MPDLMLDDIPVALDAKAKAKYTEMESTMLLEAAGEMITAANAAVLTGKLLQLCSGAVYTAAGDSVSIHCCKLDALAELIEGLQGERALLFYGYQHELSRLEQTVRQVDTHLRVRKYTGAADAAAWNRGEIDVMLAHPASCAYGLNLQHGGHHVIWYTLSWSLELYQQANARLHRQGQEHPVIIHRLLVRGGMDQAVASALVAKDGVQEALIHALNARITAVQKGELTR